MSEEEGNYQVGSVERTAIPPFVASPGYAPFALEPSQSRDVPTLARDGGAAHRLTHLDLFSGIGGFALAARWAGIETIGFSEINKHASAVLAKHWPTVKNYGDIRKVTGVRADIITGGFPCQPFSLAGQRRGAEDDRYLWPEMLRVVSEARPSWVVGENVLGITNMALDRVLSDLGTVGYACQVFDIPACAVDAKHRRRRIWIVAHADDSKQEQPQRDSSGGGCAHESRFGDGAGASGRNIAGDTSEGSEVAGRSASGIPQVLADANGVEARRFAVAWRERAEWLPEPGVGRVANGIPGRMDRIKGLGNAIVPQLAFVFLDAIAALEFGGAVAGARLCARAGKQEHNGAQEHNDGDMRRVTRASEATK